MVLPAGGEPTEEQIHAGVPLSLVCTRLKSRAAASAYGDEPTQMVWVRGLQPNPGPTQP